MKAYLVMYEYTERSNGVELYTDEHIEKAFDSLHKAIGYIRDRLLEMIDEMNDGEVEEGYYEFSEDPGEEWIRSKLLDENRIMYLDNKLERASYYVREIDVE